MNPNPDLDPHSDFQLDPDIQIEYKSTVIFKVQNTLAIS
jgi:hypothetical protein